LIQLLHFWKFVKLAIDSGNSCSIAFKREKIQQIFYKGVAFLTHETMPGALIFDEFGPRYAPSKRSRILRRDEYIIGAGCNQSGILNFRQAIVGV
jgi:hypothetical protein